jgi:RimJ/RimL family protein N-acetyltransferase
MSRVASGGSSHSFKLEGQRIIIRPMHRADVDEMIRWRPFADPMYQPFDFPRKNRAEQLRWFDWRSKDPTRRLNTIETRDGRVIGSLTLRDMQRPHSARLGITIGADFVSQGYGTEALQLYLDYYFGEMGFRRIVLDVAATNLRAVRTYRALGFRRTGTEYRAASHASYRVLLREHRYRHLRRFFRRQGTGYSVLFYDMAMSRREWEARRAASG